MKVQLDNIGKRYKRDWIIKDLSHVFEPNSKTAITGPNGSGKSTLLKMLSGYLTPNQGSISFIHESTFLERENIFKNVSYCAPYTNVPSEFTLIELLRFQHSLKPFAQNFDVDQIPDRLTLGAHKNKLISNFSSGMRQRVKLGMALFSDASLVLLDEPTSNLDKAGIEWFSEAVSNHTSNKTVIICSNNQPAELGLCKENLALTTP
ncbi:MAG: ABC transporter ATP-binding protein [Flavobacteriales bacterium]|nr:ABC transporter ATP-binding protein [Flavobacteriales bacterium]